VLDRGSLDAALRGVRVAYYMVHSMGSTGSFEENDRRAARNFGEAAREAGLDRIIYLGGLGDAEQKLSAHLRSRQEVGEILRASGVPVIEFRASIVIGSGSLSFELIRSLVERLPVMLTPKWVSTPAQPIAVEDLIAYLTAGLNVPSTGSRTFEIGGRDRVSYGDIMRAYAHCRGMRLVMIRVPVLTPYLSSLWLGLVTPLYARIGRKLVESVVHATVVKDDAAIQAFPIKPMGMEESVRRAIANGEEFVSEPVSLIPGHCPCRCPRRMHLHPLNESAGPPAGTHGTCCGSCAASLIFLWGASACGGVVPPPTICGSATRWISGE
jgi:uncharacterized protein YbjT (DUF2867 family)